MCDAETGDASSIDPQIQMIDEQVNALMEAVSDRMKSLWKTKDSLWRLAARYHFIAQHPRLRSAERTRGMMDRTLSPNETPPAAATPPGPRKSAHDVKLWRWPSPRRIVDSGERWV